MAILGSSDQGDTRHLLYMDSLISILAVLAGIIGIAGSILPALPGTPVSWVGLLMLYIWGNGTNADGDPMTMKVLVIWAIVVAAVSVIDYIVPMYFTKITGGSKFAERGAMAGLICGHDTRFFPRSVSFRDVLGQEGGRSCIEGGCRLIPRFPFRNRHQDHSCGLHLMADLCIHRLTPFIWLLSRGRSACAVQSICDRPTLVLSP